MDSNYETLVSSADVQAARARARSLTCTRYALENSPDRALPWEARYLQTPVPIAADEFVSQRLENIRESIKQELKGHSRTAITPRPAYRRSLNAANCDLMSFREKFEEWKMTYDREIGKTKASLASMTPTLHGLGLAARFHKIAGRAAESLNGTPANETTPCNTVASTPRTFSDMNTSTHQESGSDSGVEPSLQPLHIDGEDLLSTPDEYPDFLEEPGLLSERSGKLAEVKEDIGVLTTIIEKKIFATHVTPNPARKDDVNVAEEVLAVDLCAWSEGALTARTIKMAEDIDAPPDDERTEAAALVEAPTPETAIAPPSPPPDAPKRVAAPRINYKADLGLDDQQPRPVNLRDNLIILAKQKGFTHVGKPVHEGVATAPPPCERERAMALLRKMYAPSHAPSPALIQTPPTGAEPKAPVRAAGEAGSQSSQMPPNVEASRSASDRSGETETPPNETKAAENGQVAGSPPNAARPTPNVARPLQNVASPPRNVAKPPPNVAKPPPDSARLERKSATGTSSGAAVDGVVTTVPEVRTDEVTVVRELVIGSYRNDPPLPLTVYEGLDSGIKV